MHAALVMSAGASPPAAARRPAGTIAPGTFQDGEGDAGGRALAAPSLTSRLGERVNSRLTKVLSWITILAIFSASIGLVATWFI
jgi:hypothetical protein